MSKATRQVPKLCGFLTFGSPFKIFLLFLTTLPQGLKAQPQPDQIQASASNLPANAAIPTFLANPTAGDGLAAASSAAAGSNSIPTPTDSANYASHNPNNAEDKGVLNYYFLLLVVFVILIFFLYWTLARRRQKRNINTRTGQQSALAQDLRTWPGRRGGAGRWRFGQGEARPEEGLDERGEAPPPYLKEPEQAHHERGHESVELHDMSRAEVKPPDYSEGPVRS